MAEEDRKQRGVPMANRNLDGLRSVIGPIFRRIQVGEGDEAKGYQRISNPDDKPGPLPHRRRGAVYLADTPARMRACAITADKERPYG